MTEMKDVFNLPVYMSPSRIDGNDNVYEVWTGDDFCIAPNVTLEEGSALCDLINNHDEMLSDIKMLMGKLKDVCEAGRGDIEEAQHEGLAAHQTLLTRPYLMGAKSAEEEK